MTLDYKTYAFTDLTADRLYAILRLRAAVFVVEQNCVYQDLDDKDQRALHLCAYAPDGRLAAYTRLLDRGVSYPDYASVGRVVTAPFARGRGLGRPLMEHSVAALHRAFGVQPVKISAQAHLQKFYGSVGFRGIGPVYDEDGIPHRAMVRE